MSFVTAMVLMWLLGSAVVAGILACCLGEGESSEAASPREQQTAERAPQPMPGAATVISQEASRARKRRPNWAT
jgi:hypothetical protein